ncbi:MAG: hypothetical protein GW893_11870 [Armatimonadetes bacterium]|nr:hypothetical protein [Armatimonadota bacterium]PIU60881.1 MAG: hypothetical protein COS85_22355 [Armatimonadetes bacterium CG07_land_8_20_14_0_80_59_28]PIY44646.1 MAG: hypothetical protein COZ05_07595 [Armatimonadetes bacterium CG_4_10_14_3_um_filter_59_10]
MTISPGVCCVCQADEQAPRGVNSGPITQDMAEKPKHHDDLDRRRRLDQIQPLLTTARRELRLVQLDQALRRCEQILQAVPDSVEALEIKGDVHRARGEHDAARRSFTRAMELAPTNRRIQEKYALLSIDMDETQRLEARQKDAAADPEKFLKELQKPLWSCVLSCILPGIGQIYNEEYPKGAFLLGAFLLTFYAAYSSLWPALQEFMKTASFTSAFGALQRMGLWELMWAFFSLILSGALWAYSIVDAPVVTLRENRARIAELGLDDEGQRLKKEVLGE